MGALAVLGMVFALVTQTLTLKQALSQFSNHIVWLILAAFILAKGFIKTGLGTRIAYYFLRFMGKNTLGLSYGLITTELLLAPFIPSNTARGAGIVFPIVSSLAKEYGSTPAQKTERKIGAYLIQLCYQTNIITSAMFITATAGNPLIVAMATALGVEITWTFWALAALVPGLLSLLVLPWIMLTIYRPELYYTPEAPQFAERKLTEMGPLKKEEWLMLGVFLLLLGLWIFGHKFGIDATTAALIGLSILLCAKVLTWEDVLGEHNAWHTFVWLSILLMMTSHLADFKAMQWFSDHVQTWVGHLPWVPALGAVCLIYFYSHYAFASMAAHISSLFNTLALVAIACGAPPILTLLPLAYFSSLCACITHYGTGTGPVYFGANYVNIKDWWRIGAILSVVYIVIWSVGGSIWWRLLGLW